MSAAFRVCVCCVLCVCVLSSWPALSLSLCAFFPLFAPSLFANGFFLRMKTTGGSLRFSGPPSRCVTTIDPMGSCSREVVKKKMGTQFRRSCKRPSCRRIIRPTSSSFRWTPAGNEFTRTRAGALFSFDQMGRLLSVSLSCVQQCGRLVVIPAHESWLKL